jgi:hypothetical protein
MNGINGKIITGYFLALTLVFMLSILMPLHTDFLPRIPSRNIDTRGGFAVSYWYEKKVLLIMEFFDHRFQATGQV